MVSFAGIVAFPGKLQIAGGSGERCADIVSQVCDILFQLLFRPLILDMTPVFGGEDSVQASA